MGKNIPNMVAFNGTIKRLLVRKSNNQSRHERVTAVRVAAARSNYRYFAMRSTDGWAIYHTDLRAAKCSAEGLSENAAAMWLLHREPRS